MIRLECFGEAVVKNNDAVNCPLRSRKHVGILLYLAATPHTVHTREDLALLLWDGVGRRERHSLSQALYDVRANVGPVLDVTTRSVSLRAHHIEFEGILFEQAAERGDYASALNLYRGEFCPNLANLGAEGFDRWLDGERERYRVLASLALRNSLWDAEECADWDSVCFAALKLVRHNALDEEAHASLMRGLWMKGDPASALLHAECLLRHSPNEQLPLVTALAGRIERSGSQSEVLSIPRRPTHLVGRKSEFKELLRSLCLPRVGGRLVVITGERGIGKSALLLELARCVAVRGMPVRWINREPLNKMPQQQDKVPGDGQVHFLDVPAQSHAVVGPIVDDAAATDTLAFVAMGKPVPTRLLSRCNAASVLHLNRLSPEDMITAMAVHFPKVPRRVLTGCALLSGGNPQLALAICRAWRVCAGSPEDDNPRDLAVHILAQSNDLMFIIDQWLSDLGATEIEVATLLATVTPDTRRVAEEHLTNAQAMGLLRLRERGWVSRSGCIRFVHPILEYALELRTGRVERARCCGGFARRLENGGLRERYAAALELERLGDTNAARGIATAVTGEALRAGNSALATAAGGVACRTAVSVMDRFEAGLLLGEAALARGSATEAVRVLRGLEGLAPSREAALDVAIKLGKAAVAEGSITGVAHQLIFEDPRKDRQEDPVGAARAALELAQLRLALAELEGAPRETELAGQLELEIGHSRSMARRFPLTWVDAVRSLFAYYVTSGSRLDAGKMLARHGDTLLQQGDVGHAMLATCRAVLELRAARLHAAEQLLRDVIDRRHAMADRLHAVAMNNLSVTLLETGRFEEAVANLEKTVTLDSEVGLPGRDRVTAHMNQAQCAFFAGLDEDAMAHCRLVTRLARCHDLAALEAQALAISGLLALWAGRHESVESKAIRARELLPRRPVDADSYLVEWFLGAVRHHKRDGEVVESLVAAAEAYDALDRLASAKLRLLAAGLSDEGARDGDVMRDSVQTLRNGGCGWFVGFAERRGRWTKHRGQRA